VGKTRDFAGEFSSFYFLGIWQVDQVSREQQMIILKSLYDQD
jgi:hypothetical protein